MRAPWLLLLLVPIGCGPASAVLRDPGAGDPFYGDTAAPADTGGTSTNPTPDFSKWNGQRTYTFPDFYGTSCTDTVTETGINVTSSPNYADALAACPSCDELYEIDGVPDHICPDATPDGQGIPLHNPTVRGIEKMSATQLRLWDVRQGYQGWRATALASGPLDGVEFTYDYSGDAFGTSYSVTGYVDFQ